MLSSLATTIFTIFLGALQLSSGAYGSTTFESDLSSSTAATMLLAFIIACHVGIGYCLIWRNVRAQRVWDDNGSVVVKPWRERVSDICAVLRGSSSTRSGTLLPRPPSTLLDIIPYVAFSSELRKDLALVSAYPVDRKKEVLRNRYHRRYGLGFFPLNPQLPGNDPQAAGSNTQSSVPIMFFGVGNHAPNSPNDVDVITPLLG